MITAEKISTAITTLYSELPSVNCSACGECCVCPSCTLSEFIHTITTISPQSLEMLITAEPVIDDRYEGNLCCPFKPQNLCTIHPSRPGACRLFGIPALSELQICDLENCQRGTTTNVPTDAAFVNAWIEKLYLFESRLYPVATEPFYVKGFNLFCWLDLFFDTSITTEPFHTIRSILEDVTTLSSFRDIYTPKTGLIEKIGRITKIENLIASGDSATLTSELRAIRDDYPLTGTYYYEEATIYLDHIASLQS